jgi:hypothetical protein
MAQYIAWAIFAGFCMNATVADAAPHVRVPTTINRIAIRHGRFVDAVTRAPFVPVGVNYYRTGITDEGKDEHAALLPLFYDHAYVENMMAQVQRWGMNVVRVFPGYVAGPHGVVTSPDATELNPMFVANVVDFLRCARSHGIRVIFTWDWDPNSNWLASQPLPTETKYHLTSHWDPKTGISGLFLFQGSVRTRANLIIQTSAAIRRADPTLLNAVFAWELENESNFEAVNAPLNQKSGTYTLGSKSYDLSSDAQKQALMDAIIVQWADVCADAVHRADPQALVSDSVFTFHAVGRKGPDTMSTDATQDSRIPARPLALVGSHLDFLDIHVYANAHPGVNPAQDAAADLNSVEWSALRPALAKAGKPVIAGETGFFHDALRIGTGDQIDVARGADVLKQHTQALHDAGFAGILYWHYGSADSTPAESCPPLKFYPIFARSLTDVFAPESARQKGVTTFCEIGWP